MPPPDDLPSFLHGVAPILDRWGYLAIAVVIGVESFGVPAPGQTIMVAAAIYSSSGRLDIWVVGIIAFIAAVLGDNVGYWIGARGGRKAVHRFGKYIFITPERLERAEKFFARRGNRIVLVARFIDGLRQLNGVIAGITAMPWRTFLIYNAIGAALWVGWWCTVAYFLGTHLVEIIERGHDYQWIAIPVIILAIAAYAYLHMRHIRKRRARNAELADSTAAAPESSAPDSPGAASVPEATVPAAPHDRKPAVTNRKPAQPGASKRNPGKLNGTPAAIDRKPGPGRMKPGTIDRGPDKPDREPDAVNQDS